jgi:hypothetical protein
MDIFEVTFQIAIAYTKVTKIQLYLPDILFIISLLNPPEVFGAKDNYFFVSSMPR